MSQLTAEIDTSKLEYAMRVFPQRLKFELADGMDHITRKFLKIFRQTRLQGPPGIKGRPHGIFTHFSRASLVSKDIEGMGMTVFSDSKISRLHEEGGRVTNPGGGKLAVPLSARTEMFTSSGKLKMQYRRPRMIKNVIPIELKGKTFLAKVKKRSKEILPLFVMKNHIRIRPRLGFYQTWQNMENERITILNASVNKAIEKA
jgi:hypothetical protein